MLSALDDGLSLEHTQIAVELKQPGCCPPHISDAENVWTIALEVLIPTILSRMKQPDGRIGIRIETKEICSLVKITMDAGEGEVLLHTLAPVLSRHDVLDMKRSIGFVLSLETTVFTAMPRPFPNQLAERRIQNQAAWMFERNAPALRRRIDISFDA